MAKQKNEGEGAVYVVAKPFRDKDDFSKEYAPGDDVSHFDAARLEFLVSNGLVEKQ